MIIELIEKKKRGEALSAPEIHAMIHAYVNKEIADYQMSAFLMAVWFQGMNMDEMIALCDAMMHSGEVLDLSDLDGVTCDKHSTGGVGDKTSIVLVPLVAACGGIIAKMSGRGLGHTGGTIDKLESIPGFQTEVAPSDFKRQVREIHAAIVGQSSRFVVADQMLYALRDVTATVDSLPLIATSILSKKLAAGSDVILLDVKYGEGAFMKTKADAQLLADTMCAIGAHFQRKVRAVISDMNEPLGHAIGNTLEVLEAIDTLQGRGPDDFRTLCIEEAGILLAMADLAADESEGRQRARSALEDGSAFAMLCQMVEAQGGDVRYVKEPQRFAKAPYIKQLPALKEGMIRALHARSFGELAMELGAGRKCKGDRIDPRVGIVLHHKCGETVAADTCIATIHANRELSEDWIRRFYEAVEIEESSRDL